MTSHISSADDVAGQILTRLGLEGENVESIYIFLSANPNSSPWDSTQYDPDGIVIRVWDPEDQKAVCAVVGMDATDLQDLTLVFRNQSPVTFAARGLVRSERADLERVLKGISGSPLTSTHLPVGRLSALGVRVPGEVVEGNRNIARGAPPSPPYADLDEEPDNS